MNDIKKTVLDYIRTAGNMVKGKAVEEAAEDNKRADVIAHDDEVEKAEEEVRRLEQQLKEAKAELARKQEEMDRFEEELTEIKPSQPPKKREAKYFLKKWRKACLWYGSIITPVVAALWFCILFVNWNEWWRIWPEPYIICPIKIFMRLLEYTLVYILVRLSFCWMFFKTAYGDPSTRDVVYMKLTHVGKMRFAIAFWNNAVLSTINFYRGVWKNWKAYRFFLGSGFRFLLNLAQENIKDLFSKNK